MTDTFNGMTGDEQPEIPLHEHKFVVRVVTSVPVAFTEELREHIADAIWKQFPPAEDGDVFVESVPDADPQTT